MPLLLNACAPTIYGVNEDQWNDLSSSERGLAIKHYQKMELLYEQSRIEGKKLALEKEKQHTLMMEAQQKHADKIYTGEAGIRGDLLRVTIRGGEVYMNGKHRRYNPLSIQIADGEQKILRFQHPKRSTYQTDIGIKYSNGILRFDAGSKYSKSYHYDFVYEPSWRYGKRYKNITLNKRSHSRAKHIEVIVDAVPLPRFRMEAGRYMQ